MTIVFFVLFFAATAWIVLSPLLKSSETSIHMLLDQTDDGRKNLQTKRSQLMLTLKETDFDYEMGKLSKEDYTSLRNKYEQETVEVLKQIDIHQEAWEKFKSKLDRSL